MGITHYLLRSLLLMTVFFVVSTSAAMLLRRVTHGYGMRVVWAAVLLLSILPIRLFLPSLIRTPSPAETGVVSVIQSATKTAGPNAGQDDGRPDIETGQDRPLPASQTETEDVQTVVLRTASAALLLVWIAGYLVTVGKLIISYRSLCRDLRTYAAPSKDKRMTGIVSEICRTLGMKNVPLYRLAPSVTASPCAVGIVSPRIYYSEYLSDMDDAPLRMVILHECLHIRHRDVLCRLIASLITAVFWFCPLRTRVFEAVCEDLEFACDLAVLKRVGDAERDRYMSSLLSVAESVSRRAKDDRVRTASPFAAVTAVQLISVNSANKLLKRRFLNMKNDAGKKGRLFSVILSAGFLAAALLLNTVLLSACAEGAAADAPSAREPIVFDSFTSALYNYLGLIDDETPTAGQLSAVSSIDVFFSSDDYGTFAYVSFNGEPVVGVLPAHLSESSVHRMTSCLLKLDGCTEEELALYNADESVYRGLIAEYSTAEDGTVNMIARECNQTRKYHAFYFCISSSDPTLNESDIAELLAMYPKAAERDFYELDPYVTDRECKFLFDVGRQAGFLTAESISEDAFRTSIGSYPELANAAVTFHEPGTWTAVKAVSGYDLRG